MESVALVRRIIVQILLKFFFVYYYQLLFCTFFRKPKGREWTENGGPWFWGKMHHHCFDGGVSGGGWQGLLAKYLSTGIFDSPEEVVKACWDPSKQSSETPNKW